MVRVRALIIMAKKGKIEEWKYEPIRLVGEFECGNNEFLVWFYEGEREEFENLVRQKFSGEVVEVIYLTMIGRLIR